MFEVNQYQIVFVSTICKHIKLFLKLTFFLLLTRILYNFIRKFVQNTVEKFHLKLSFSFPLITHPYSLLNSLFFMLWAPEKVSSYISRLRVQMANIAMMFPWEYTNQESINTVLSTKIFTLLSLENMRNRGTSILCKNWGNIVYWYSIYILAGNPRFE